MSDDEGKDTPDEIEISEMLRWLKHEATQQHLPITFGTTPSYISPLTISIPAATGAVHGDISTKVDALQRLEEAWNERIGKNKRRLLLIPQS